MRRGTGGVGQTKRAEPFGVRAESQGRGETERKGVVQRVWPAFGSHPSSQGETLVGPSASRR